MPVRISREYEISAGHHLPKHEGKCRTPHGHNYLIEVTLRGTSLITEGPSTGMVLDFSDLDIMVNSVLGQLDHKNLNELRQFSTDGDYHPPTAENIGRWVWNELADIFPQNTGKAQVAELDNVRIYETKRSWVDVSMRWQ